MIWCWSGLREKRQLSVRTFSFPLSIKTFLHSKEVSLCRFMCKKLYLHRYTVIRSFHCKCQTCTGDWIHAIMLEIDMSNNKLDYYYWVWQVSKGVYINGWLVRKSWHPKSHRRSRMWMMSYCMHIVYYVLLGFTLLGEKTGVIKEKVEVVIHSCVCSGG